mmetsp:Transcript_17796/g.28804  ORF Transcript_17796/g.28804 Transcript_17796/m.28804 type:complete len:390 (+) Transcript_17796:3412-4581(+)|eukprot:CAMPEP_0203787816 /NCGR_PEP_ID=MMETSP0100_2-20121128/2466_1 /ASSEMBLY_ACC=CAM_ASM_000210 /TAXON_ID=96639 /ORGANISM=" , Strain NY0313808BC1" /LENGTH=389 /DNA_ID=CAMNT_0050690419 /DNA_START=5646 /DNA_END=6815 /DNA_ORIENTATION=+
MAEAAKAEGNELLKAGKFDEAVDAYSRAIDLDGSNHIYYSNRSAAYGKMQNWSLALADASKCVDLDPSWAKGYSRQVSAYIGLGDLDKAKKAAALCKEKGGNPPAVRPPAPRAASATSGGFTGPASMAELSTLAKVLIGLRMFMLVNFVLYTVPFTSSYGSYQRCLFCAFALYLIQLYCAHGAPQGNAAYAQKVMIDYRAQYAMVALLFAFVGQSSFFQLLPHIMSEIGHVADFLIRYQPHIAQRASPTLNGMVLPRLVAMPPAEWNGLSTSAKWSRYNARVLSLNAGFEVAIGISLIVQLLTPSRNFLLVFGYWHQMRIRYMVSAEIKSTFSALDQKISGLTASYPPVANGYQKARTYLASWVAIPTAEQAQQQSQGMQGMMSKCSIS